jgi:hypothetical protein
MDINDFAMEILAEAGKKLGSGYEASVIKRYTNNGIMKHGLNIGTCHARGRCCIFLDRYFESYQSGKIGIGEIVDEAIRICKIYEDASGMNIDFVTDYSRAKEYLRGELVNTDRNRDALELVPHREFLDLSVIYSLDVPCGNPAETGSVRITMPHMKKWGVDEETLYRQAMANMEENEKCTLDGLTELVSVMREGQCQLDDAGENPMYVLSNQRKANGAVQMLNPHAMEMAVEILGTEIIILPSSVHEVILLAAGDDGAEKINQLAMMVSEINATAVSSVDFLSNHVYRYSHETGEITIAA